MQNNNNYKENVRRKIPTTRHKNGHERKKKMEKQKQRYKNVCGHKNKPKLL